MTIPLVYGNNGCGVTVYPSKHLPPRISSRSPCQPTETKRRDLHSCQLQFEGLGIQLLVHQYLKGAHSHENKSLEEICHHFFHTSMCRNICTYIYYISICFRTTQRPKNRRQWSANDQLCSLIQNPLRFITQTPKTPKTRNRHELHCPCNYPWLSPNPPTTKIQDIATFAETLHSSQKFLTS